MEKRKKVIVLDYDPQWAIIFENLQYVFQSHLGSLIEDIQHVGSTAVPGLAAKPIIDIDLIVENKEKMQAVINKVCELGYNYVGDLGISGREVFKPISDKSPDNRTGKVWNKHHLYACIKGCTSLENHLKFRDYLRNHPEKRKTYSALKKQLAQEHPHDIDAYIEKKTPFITTILEKTGFSRTELKNITLQNKAK